MREMPREEEGEEVTKHGLDAPHALIDGEWRIGPRRVLVWIPIPITDEEARAAHARCQRARQTGTMADLDPRTLKAERAYQRRKKRAKVARRTA
jgi:hypothetical protein